MKKKTHINKIKIIKNISVPKFFVTKKNSKPKNKLIKKNYKKKMSSIKKQILGVFVGLQGPRDSSIIINVFHPYRHQLLVMVV